MLGSQLSAWPDWLHGSVVQNIYTGALDLSGTTPIAVSLVVLVGAGVLTWRRAKDAVRFDVLLVFAIIAAVVSVSRIVGDIFPYLVTWTWAFGMLTWLAIAWSVVRWWQHRDATDAARREDRTRCRRDRTRRRDRRQHRRRRHAGNPDPRFAHGGHVASEGARRSRPVDGVVEIRAGTTPGSVWIGAGIADELERDGIDTVASRHLEFAYGPDRVVGDERVRLVVLPVEDDVDHASTRLLR